MIVYAPRALRDLQAIETYIQQFDATAAQRVIAAIKRTIDTLDSFPHIGTVKSEAGHRRVNVGRYPYAVFYRDAGGTVLILHIRHTAQKPIDPETEL
jgi:toxin ParE1/3/4